MSSSTSNSEAREWRRFIRTFCLVLAGGGMVVSVLLLGSDPYGTGDFPLFPDAGLPQASPRFTKAGLARQPGVDSAIIGNSHSQLLAPDRLNATTERRFVSLTIPGTGPREQLAVTRWFLRHHPVPQALVIGVDALWCGADLTETNPFPYWLYTTDRLEFARRALRYQTVKMAVGKLAMAVGKWPRMRADGYEDYEQGRVLKPFEVANRDAEPQAPLPEAPVELPASIELAALLRTLPAETKVALVFPPVYAPTLPRPGSAAAARIGACKDAFRRLDRVHPGVVALDFMVEDAMTRDMKNFWDSSHYGVDVARAMEAVIGQVLAVPGR